jgi:rubredoxin
VTPVDDQSPFGYCEACGIVYALRDRLQGRPSRETPRVIELQSDEEPVGTDKPGGAAHVDAEEPSEHLGSRWRCPDCGTLLESANESDLEFLKREHIREYHPNRSS